MFERNEVIENYYAMIDALHNNEPDPGFQQGIDMDLWAKHKDAVFAYRDKHGLTTDVLTRYRNAKRNAYRASSVADAVSRMQEFLAAKAR